MDRRNDLGGKVLLGILVAVIAFLLTDRFTLTYQKASIAEAKAQEISVKQASQEECLNSIKAQLAKIDIKIDRILNK